MKTVLVVDDSRSARMIFIRCLRIAGFDGAEFLEAGDGQAAIELVEERSDVGLALIDLNMPTMDGLTLVHELRARPALRGLRIIVASSLINDAARSRLAAAGADAVIEKPISPAILVETLAGLGGN